MISASCVKSMSKIRLTRTQLAFFDFKGMIGCLHMKGNTDFYEHLNNTAVIYLDSMQSLLMRDCKVFCGRRANFGSI